MPKLLVFEVDSPSSKLRGILQRIFHEIRPGSFVGKVPSKAIKPIWDAICANSKSAIIVIPTNNEVGFRIGTHGDNRRMPSDNFGIQLMTYKKSRKESKNEE